MVEQVQEVIKNIRNQLNFLESIVCNLNNSDGQVKREVATETVDTVKQGELMGYSRETINEYLYGKDGID